MSTHQMNFRCDKMLRNILIVKDNYSEFIRGACWEKLNKEGDQTLLKAEKQNLQNRIKEIDHELKPKVNEDKIQELMSYHALNYKLNATMRTESQRFRFIEKSILPQLKKAGSRASLHEIDELLINWPD